MRFPWFFIKLFEFAALGFCCGSFVCLVGCGGKNGTDWQEIALSNFKSKITAQMSLRLNKMSDEVVANTSKKTVVDRLSGPGFQSTGREMVEFISVMGFEIEFSEGDLKSLDESFGPLDAELEKMVNQYRTHFNGDFDYELSHTGRTIRVIFNADFKMTAQEVSDFEMLRRL